jgi:hypothetical protein
VLSATLAIGTNVARAASPAAIHMQVQDCPAVDAGEVERLLRLELQPLGATSRPLEVTLTCSGPRVRMVARDPNLDRQLTRDVVIGPPDPGRDRTIALLVSQLFLSARAQDLLERPAPAAAVVVAPPPVAPAPSRRWELEVAAGARARDWSSPATGEWIAAGAGRRAGPVRLLATAEVERGSAQRSAGVAIWTIEALGAGVAWRSGVHGRLALDATFVASLALAQARGEPASASFAGNSVSGVLGQAALSAGPSLSWSHLRLGLRLQIGATFPGATAQVSGDRDLRLGGAWAGAGLSVGWGWR